MSLNTSATQNYLAKFYNNSNWRQSLEAEYLLFIDVLKYQRCDRDIAMDISNYSGNDQSNLLLGREENNKNEKRRKRGVMENIVSAYSDVFTKGYVLYSG